jgi:hypothetical protein
MVGKIWPGLDEAFRLRVLASALDAHGEDLRRHFLDKAARGLRMRSVVMLAWTNQRVAEKFLRGFTMLPEKDQIGWISSRYAATSLQNDFNECIGLGPNDPCPADAPARQFDESCFGAFLEKHGADELTLALAFAAATGRRDCTGSAREILERRLKRAKAERTARPAASMQEASMPEAAVEGAAPAAPDTPAAPSVESAPPRDRVEVPVPAPDFASNASASAEPEPSNEVVFVGDASIDAASAQQILASCGAGAPEPASIPLAAVPTQPAPQSRIAPSGPFRHPKVALAAVDRLVIQAIVTSLLGQTAATVRREELTDLVRDFVNLNVQRFESYYLLGFLHGIRAEAQEDLGLAANRARRGWYLAGYLHGTFRAKGDAAFVAAVDALSEGDLAAFGDPQSSGACPRILASVVEAAIDANRPDLLVRWLRLAGPGDEVATRNAVRWVLARRVAASGEEITTVATVLESLRACRYLSESGPAHTDPDEIACLLAMFGLCSEIGASDTSADVVLLSRELATRVVELAEGGAGTRSDDLLHEVETALVVSQIGIRRPSELVPLDAKGAARRHARLAAVLEAQGIGPSHPLRVLERLLRGIMRLRADRATLSDAVELDSECRDLVLALRRMHPVRERWGSLRAEEFARVLEVLADLIVLLVGDEKGMDRAVASLTEWLDEEGSIDPALCGKALEHAAIVGSARLPGLFRAAARKHGASAFQLSDVHALARDAESRMGLFVLLTSAESPIPFADRMQAIADLCGVAAGQNDPQLARECIDHLRERAAKSILKVGPVLRKALDDPRLERVLEESELHEISIDVALRTGDFESAGLQMVAEFQRALSDDEIGLAQDYLEMLEERGLRRMIGDEQRAWLASKSMPTAGLARDGQPKQQQQPVRIYFIGGNEIQAQWDETICRKLQKEAPGVAVEFLHTGWESNWGAHVDEIERRIDQFSAVVLMKFVRTILGEKVRRLASERRKPWIPCTGHGMSSVYRSIVTAAGVARRGRG